MSLLVKFFYLLAYIRIIIEASLFAFMSAFIEFSNFESGEDHTISYIFACLFVIFLLSLPIFVFILYKKQGEAATVSYFGEFFEGTKAKKLARFYIIVFLIRRFLTVFIIVTMRNTHAVPRCICF